LVEAGLLTLQISQGLFFDYRTVFEVKVRGEGIGFAWALLSVNGLSEYSGLPIVNMVALGTT